MQSSIFFVSAPGLGHEACLKSIGVWQAAPYNGQDYGIMLGDPALRPILDAHHDDLVTLPGARGALNAEQAAFIATSVPTAHEGMMMRDLMALVYADTGWENYNPDNY